VQILILFYVYLCVPDEEIKLSSLTAVLSLVLMSAPPVARPSSTEEQLLTCKIAQVNEDAILLTIRCHHAAKWQVNWVVDPVVGSAWAGVDLLCCVK
jgi:hypothetical protein